MYGLNLSLFDRYIRMSPESFKYLLNVVGPIISKEDTRFQKAIPSAERLCLTLHYLTYRGSQQSLSFSFRITKSITCSIINETCKAIWDCLSEQYVRPPRTSDDWKRIAKYFENIWNLPQCIGAIDGKHVWINSPLTSGSLYYNYEDFFRFAMLATYFPLSILVVLSLITIVECFVTRWGKHFFNDEMILPVAECLENSPTFGKLPYFLVGDEVFHFQNYFRRPYPSAKEYPKNKGFSFIDYLEHVE